MTRRTRFALAAGLALLALGFGLRQVLSPAAAPTPNAKPNAPAPNERPSSLTVSRTQGHVELRDAESGRWEPLAADAQVSERDSVRTTDDASAVLVAGDGLRVEVAERSEVELLRLTGPEAKLVVERGRLSAQVAGVKQSVSVAVRGSDAVVNTDGAAFSVLRDEQGQVAVAVTDGDVTLSAQKVRVRVASGQQSWVGLDRAPATPTRIPPSLFLKVARTGPRLLNQRTTDLSGDTTTGAVVYINGVAAATDPEGHFSAHVELREGKNDLHIKAVDVLGRSQREQLPSVTVDTQPPKLQGKTIW